MDHDRPDGAVIADAAARLRAGQLVVFPTETVYGLGAHALDPVAVAAIFDAKGRPSTDPLIVHLADTSMLPLVARELFDAIRALDASGAGTLLALAPEAVGIGAAVHDRLMRACEGRVLRADDPPPSPSR